MGAIWRNSESNLEVDPVNNKGRHEAWVKRITRADKSINYHSFREMKPKTSELLTKYILDLDVGVNLAKGVKRGKRSYVYLATCRIRLCRLLGFMEGQIGKETTKFTEQEVIKFFQMMQDGQLFRKDGLRYRSTQDFVRVFAVFWRWYMRMSAKEGTLVPDVVSCLDLAGKQKPKWQFFSLKDVELMAENAPNLYYKTLIYFLFDSGIRAPKELMNVRAMDITPVPNSNQLFLEIRDDTSKTYGRKIKLMICSEILRRYIETHKLKGEDFLFSRSYHVMHRVISKIGCDVLGRGKLIPRKNYKVYVKDGISMYDFRHNSVCHYLPIYRSENQMKYRYGWSKADMISYYSEFMGMKDTITEEDMVTDSSKMGLQLELEKEKQRVAILQEQMQAQKVEFDERMKKLEAVMLQKFADNF